MSSPASAVANAVYDSVLALMYPQGCAVCGAVVESRRDGVACAACWDSTRRFHEADQLCWKCGALSVAMMAIGNIQSLRCGRCETDHFTVARAAGLYEAALRASVLALKRDPHVSHRLLQELAGACGRAPIDNAELIIPVPLHPARERERGHNQASVLARALARVTKLQIDEHTLVRHAHTEKHRAGMDSRARHDSVARAFGVRRPELISGRRILLIDDVFTTGATVSECAKVLKAAGAAEVFVLTIARA